MNTSREDTDPGTTASTEADQAPDSGSAPSPEQADASGAFLSGAAAPSPGGLFSSETFGVAAVMLFALASLNTRVLQLFGSFVVGSDPRDYSAGEVGMLAGEVVVAGGLSALAVLTAALSLFLGGPATRAWSRWTAAATVIVGTVLVLACVLTFAHLPSAS